MCVRDTGLHAAPDCAFSVLYKHFSSINNASYILTMHTHSFLFHRMRAHTARHWIMYCGRVIKATWLGCCLRHVASLFPKIIR